MASTILFYCKVNKVTFQVRYRSKNGTLPLCQPTSHCLKFKKERIICSLSVLCSPRLFLTRSHQISGQNMSEAREPEGLVKITDGIVASSFFKRAGNSN